MWRALSLSIGLTFILLGLQCLVVEQVVVKNIRGGSSAEPTATAYQNPTYQNASYQTNLAGEPAVKPKYRLIQTKDWMPWSMLAVGAVVVIYTFSLPRRSSSPTE